MKYQSSIFTYKVLIVLLIYFVACLLLHEEAEKPFEWFVKNYGNARLSLVLNIFFLITAAVMLFMVIKRVANKIIPNSLKWMGILVAILSYASYYYLMPYKSEGIHFLQYAIMGFLSFQIMKNAWVALNFSYLLGILDEGFQFIIGNSLYFDFNDILLNFFGSAIGILCILYFQKTPPVEELNPYQFVNWCTYLMVWGFMTTLIMLYLLGILCIHPDDGCSLALHKLDRGRWSNNFIDCTHWGKCWHRVKAVEGMILTSIIPLPILKLVHFRSRI